MLVFDNFLSENSTTTVNVALQLSDFLFASFENLLHFCHFLVTVALLGSFLADPGPPEARTTARTFQIS